MNIIKTIATAAALAALLLAYGIVGTMDYEDAVAADRHYTEMVCAGLWPDYDGRRPDCSASRNTGAHASGQGARRASLSDLAGSPGEGDAPDRHQ